MKFSGKKWLAVVAAGWMIAAALGAPDTAEAAKAGMRAPRVTAPAPRPKPAAPKPAAPQQNARPNQQYTPSQKASEAPGTAPKANAGANTANAPAAAQQDARWGGAMRSIGLLAGGMMLGNLLGHLFGFGAGSFMADVLGLLANVAIFVAVFLLARMLWAKFRASSSGAEENPYQRGGETPRAQTAAKPDFPIRDIRPPEGQRLGAQLGTDYDPKRTADAYRSR